MPGTPEFDLVGLCGGTAGLPVATTCAYSGMNVPRRGGEAGRHLLDDGGRLPRFAAT